MGFVVLAAHHRGSFTLCKVCPLPQFALRASRGDDLPVHGDGTSHRSFLFVEDVAEAFEVVLHKVSTPLVSDSLPRPGCLGMDNLPPGSAALDWTAIADASG